MAIFQNIKEQFKALPQYLGSLIKPKKEESKQTFQFDQVKTSTTPLAKPIGETPRFTTEKPKETPLAPFSFEPIEKTKSGIAASTQPVFPEGAQSFTPFDVDPISRSVGALLKTGELPKNPKEALERAFVEKEAPFAFEVIQEKGEKLLEEKPILKKIPFSKYLPIIAGLAAEVALPGPGEFTALGKLKKLKLSEEAIDLIAKETNPEKLKGFVRVAGVPEEIIENTAEVLAKVENPKEVKQYLTKAINYTPEAAKGAKPAYKLTTEGYNKLADYIDYAEKTPAQKAKASAFITDAQIKDWRTEAAILLKSEGYDVKKITTDKEASKALQELFDTPSFKKDIEKPVRIGPGTEKVKPFQLEKKIELPEKPPSITKPIRGEAGRFAGSRSVKGTPLFEEARKYKSAEEFVMAQPKVFRGTSDVVNQNILRDTLGKGRYFSTSEKVAGQYGKIEEASFSGLNVKKFNDINEYDDFVQPFYLKLRDSSPIWDGSRESALKIMSEAKDVANKELIKQGFDGISTSIHTGENLSVIFPESISKIKNKSQLADIWNEAHGVEGITNKGKTPIQSAGAFAGFHQDEDGNWQFSPERALAGVIGVAGITKGGKYYEKYLDQFIKNPKSYDDVAKNLDVELRAIDDTIKQHPAYKLTKYANRNGELPEVLGKLESKFGKSGDDLVTELGFEDSESARRAYEELQRLRQIRRETLSKVNQVKTASIIAKREKLAEKMNMSALVESDFRTTGAKSLEPGAYKKPGKQMKLLPEESPPPPKPKIGRGGLQAPELNFLNWKDKPAFGLSRETFERNIDRVAGSDSKAVREFVVDPIAENETKRARFLTDLRTEVRDEMKRLAIKANTEADADVMRFGEGRLGEEALIKKYGQSRANQIIEASQYFRKTYDKLLDSINETRKKFGYAIIPARKDYFRHFQEIGSYIEQFGVMLKSEDLPTSISGMTEFFTPGKPFTNVELRRYAKETKESAIRGLDNYLNASSRQIFHTDSVQRIRQLEGYLRNQAKYYEDIQNMVEGIVKELPPKVNLPNFVANLKEYGNLIAGKKSVVDRGLEAYVGRKVFTVLDFLRRQTGANMVGGNISSALTNFIPFTQVAAATDKIPFLRGMLSTITDIANKDKRLIDGIQSGFLTRRFVEDVIHPNALEKTRDIISSLFKFVDYFTSKTAVAGKYYELVKKGMSAEDAMKAADQFAAKVIADRSIGQQPNLFASKSFGTLMQFQLEVNNIVSWILRDLPKEAKGKKAILAGMVTQYFLYSYIYNNIFEHFTGRRPTIDPIHGGLTLAGLTDQSEEQTINQRVMEFSKDVANNIPFVSFITGGRLPVSAGVPNLVKVFQGEDIPQELAKPAIFFGAPFGGLQAKKTFEGVKSFLTKEVKTKAGNVKAEISQTFGNFLRGAVFGPSAFKETIKANKTLNEIYSHADRQTKDQLEMRKKAEKELKNLIKNKGPEAQQKFLQLIKEDRRLAETIVEVFKDQQAGLNSVDIALKQLNIMTGDRAKEIHRQMNKLKTRDEKMKFIGELIKKKVVSETVLKQLIILMKNEAEK